MQIPCVFQALEPMAAIFHYLHNVKFLYNFEPNFYFAEIKINVANKNLYFIIQTNALIKNFVQLFILFKDLLALFIL